MRITWLFGNGLDLSYGLKTSYFHFYKYLLELEKNETLTNKLKNNDSINLGSQIRSYILEPYKLVKDYRTNFESNDPDSILNGEIMDMLIYNVKEMK